MESGILVAMAFDRYVAICNPLRYSMILKNSVVAKICLAVVLRSGIITLPYPFLVRQWPYCRTNNIPHFYCGYIAVLKLACADIRINSYYGLFNLISVSGMDMFFIAVSYSLILRAIFRLPTKDARLKTFRPAWSWPFMMRHWNKQPLRRDPATAAAGSVVSPRPVRVQTVLPSMFDAGVGIMQSWFCACWDSSWVLYTCVLLLLVICVAMATQHSFSWRSRMALLVSRLRRRGTEDEGEGAKKQRVKQPRERLCRDPPRHARRAARRRSIRQLLCDNSDCALCDEAARQAERLVYTDRVSAWVPAGPGSPPTPASYSAWIYEPFPPSQAEHGWVGSFLSRGRARSPQAAPQRQAHRPDWVPFLAKSPGGTRMSGREAKRQRDQESTAPRVMGEAPLSLAGRPPARVSPGALRVPGRLELAEAETPFLQRDVRASLERHVQVKRLQHTLGLPCTLQSALKIFMPPAPKPIARRPSGAGRVVTMPQALPFLSVASRTELERHLQRMVHLKRWGLPRRIQESLRLLMPATPPHPRLSPLPSGRWAPRGPGPVTRAAQTPGLRARAPAQASQGPARASKSAPGSHCCRDTRELQGHIARKGLEIRLGALPAVLRSSQKMAALGRRDLLLPKLIPPGCKAPLARHRLCPLLSCKAGSVELNVRHKHIQYLWALPTLYAESLAKMVPCPPMPPAPLFPWVWP
ncbi:protein FAM205A-like [Mauremys mutica]|uniref:protein FAM205A-like n=1 Tax=Mauremys mutica TaxID=74926 RepID=UPI001D15B841|nr:protein FAM205A-like [Mauremys mutica]